MTDNWQSELTILTEKLSTDMSELSTDFTFFLVNPPSTL
jgi:hypothetical protein